jgi:predicted enzyme related to lactoylglutathione lyase
MATPFGELRFLYVGSAKFDEDLRYYRDVLGAEKAWHFHAFDARVAAFRVGPPGAPLVLIADHRPAPSCLPIFAVPDLDAAARELRARGWKPEGEVFEIPNGPCYLFKDPSGNEYAIFEDARPGAMESSYEDASNPRAIHGG